jgi:hypothetical protein
MRGECKNDSSSLVITSRFYLVNFCTGDAQNTGEVRMLAEFEAKVIQNSDLDAWTVWIAEGKIDGSTTPFLLRPVKCDGPEVDPAHHAGEPDTRVRAWARDGAAAF